MGLIYVGFTIASRWLCAVATPFLRCSCGVGIFCIFSGSPLGWERDVFIMAILWLYSSCIHPISPAIRSDIGPLASPQNELALAYKGWKPCDSERKPALVSGRESFRFLTLSIGLFSNARVECFTSPGTFYGTRALEAIFPYLQVC